MAIFSWKKGTGEDKATAGTTTTTGGVSTGTGGPVPEFTPEPEKARKWFDFAKTYAESTNFEAALNAYANGIKLDPETMSAHEGMLVVARKYVSRGGKPATGKEIKQIEDAHPVSKFAAAEFAAAAAVAAPVSAQATPTPALRP